MVTGKIIDYNPLNKTYSLSEEKAKFLSRDGIYNFAFFH
jgi:hypothetical protein